MDMLWIVFGILSVGITFINLFRSFQGKTNNWMIYSFLGFAFPLLLLLSLYGGVKNWVLAEDWTALMDVVPMMYSYIFVFVVAIIAANWISISQYAKGLSQK